MKNKLHKIPGMYCINQSWYLTRHTCLAFKINVFEVVFHLLRRELLGCYTPGRGRSPDKTHQTPPNQTECCRRKVWVTLSRRWLKTLFSIHEIFCERTCKCWSWGDLLECGSVPSRFPQLFGNILSAEVEKKCDL